MTEVRELNESPEWRYDVALIMRRYYEEMGHPVEWRDCYDWLEAFGRHGGFVYCFYDEGFMLVERHSDPFIKDGDYWKISIAYVIPEKRNSSVLSRLLSCVLDVHKGKVMAASFSDKGSDHIMMKRFKHVGNIYEVRES